MGESGFFDTLTEEVETLTEIIADHNRLPKGKRGRAKGKVESVDPTPMPENGGAIAEKAV